MKIRSKLRNLYFQWNNKSAVFRSRAKYYEIYTLSRIKRLFLAVFIPSLICITMTTTVLVLRNYITDSEHPKILFYSFSNLQNIIAWLSIFVFCVFALTPLISLHLENLRLVSISLLYKIGHPVIYSIPLTIIFTIIYVKVSPLIQKLIATDSTVIQGFIEWVGIPYSFLASMILVRSWERVEFSSDVLAKESSAISDLLDRIDLIKSSQISQKINGLIREYVEHVDNYYQTEHNESSQEAIGNSKAKAIQQEAHQVMLKYPNLTYLNLTQKVDGILDARKKRLLNSKNHLPTPVSVLLFLSSILWLCLFLTINLKNSLLAMIIVSNLTFIVISIMITVVYFYEPVNIKWNDVYGSWVKLKMRM
jgi:hypothetical protein